MSIKKNKSKLFLMHQYLLDYFGKLNWWPGDSALEVMVGAILTQNTNWNNVSKAIERIKKEEILDVESLFRIDEQYLGQLIKPCGYYNLKAKRLKNFINYLYLRYNGSTEEMFSRDLFPLRTELLDLNGVGPETADSILLYAGNKPVFVVDAYTRRIFERHGCISAKDSYEQIQQYFMKNLPQDYHLYNEFHAQIVMVGKNYCKPNKLDCGKCPLSVFFE